MNSIFVQIAAYRDLELPVTIQNAIDNSSGKNNITIGVHNCVKFNGEVVLSGIKTPPWVSIKYTESIAPESVGVSASRNKANSLYSGEDYYFQVDSHSQFVQDWDDLAVSDYLWYIDRGISEPLITMYPPNYKYVNNTVVRDKVDTGYSTKISFMENKEQFFNTYIPTQLAIPIPKECYYTPSVSAGMIFTSGRYASIPPNKKIAFWGEEILTAARAFTNGFNLVTARHHLIWHLYHSDQPIDLVKRHHVWKDYPDLWSNLDSESRAEVYRIFSEEIIGVDGLGSERTLEQFGQFAGLDFKNKLVL